MKKPTPLLKNPTRYESTDGKVAIKLDMLPGDMALVAGVSGAADAQGVMVFVYPDESVTIIGTCPKGATIGLLQQAIRAIAIVPDCEIPTK